MQVKLVGTLVLNAQLNYISSNTSHKFHNVTLNYSVCSVGSSEDYPCLHQSHTPGKLTTGLSIRQKTETETQNAVFSLRTTETDQQCKVWNRNNTIMHSYQY